MSLYNRIQTFERRMMCCYFLLRAKHTRVRCSDLSTPKSTLKVDPIMKSSIYLVAIVLGDSRSCFSRSRTSWQIGFALACRKTPPVNTTQKAFNVSTSYTPAGYSIVVKLRHPSLWHLLDSLNNSNPRSHDRCCHCLSSLMPASKYSKSRLSIIYY